MKKSTVEKIKGFLQTKLGEKDQVIIDLKKELENAKVERGNKFVMNLPEHVKLETPEVQKVVFDHAVEIKNLNEIKIPEEIKVRNFPKEISINNLPKTKEVQKVEVINKESNTPPTWLEGVMSAFLGALGSMLAKVVQTIGKMTFKIELPDDFYTRPIQIIQIDRNTGKPLDRKNYQPVISTGGGGGGYSGAPANMPMSTILSGKKLIAHSGTAEALSDTSQYSKKVTITALYTNQGNIYIGNADVSAVNSIGIPLIVGQSFELAIDDLNKIYIDAEQDNDGVSYIALK